MAARLARRHPQPARLPGTRGDRPYRRRGRRRRGRHQAAEGRRPHRLARGDDAGRPSRSTLVVDQQTGIVTWYTDGRRDLHGERRLGVAAAGRQDLHCRYPRSAGEDDDRRRLHLRGVAGGGGPHRRLRPARLGPRAGRVLTHGRRRLRRPRQVDGLGARSCRSARRRAAPTNPASRCCTRAGSAP